jgi:hypothetical protein
MTEKGTHLDHCEDNAEGGKNGLGWCDAAEFLRKVRGFDGNIERGEDDFSTLLSLSVGGHGFEVEIAGKNVIASRL